MSMTIQGETLLKLVELDRVLWQISNQQSDLPQRAKLVEIRELQQQLNEKAEQTHQLYQRQELNIKALTDEMAMIEQRVSENHAHIEKNASNYKEVSIISGDIDTLNRRAEKITFEKGELNQGLARIAAVADQIDERLLLIATRQTELSNSLETDSSRLEEQSQKLKEQRSKLIDKLPEELVRHYDKVRMLKAGIGAAALDGRLCYGCHIELTEGQVARVKREADEFGIGNCPTCHRILVL